MSSMIISDFQWRSRGGGGGAGGDCPLTETLPPCPHMKLHFVQRSMESRHFESQSAPLLTPEPPLATPLFEKSGYAPVDFLNRNDTNSKMTDKKERKKNNKKVMWCE